MSAMSPTCMSPRSSIPRRSASAISPPPSTCRSRGSRRSCRSSIPTARLSNVRCRTVLFASSPCSAARHARSSTTSATRRSSMAARARRCSAIPIFLRASPSRTPLKASSASASSSRSPSPRPAGNLFPLLTSNLDGEECEMTDENAQGIATTAKIGGHPLHPLLVTLPIGLWVMTFIFDLGFLFTGDAFWARGGLTVLIAGIIFAVIAALAGFTDFFGNQRIRDLRDAWQHMIGNVIALVLSILNLWPHWDITGAGVKPWGVLLSLVVVLILLFTGWKGGEMVFRHHVGSVRDGQ